MERLGPGAFEGFSVSRLEHEHRYRCAAAIARGAVLDVACGIGYGAPIVLGQSAVSRYVGVDTAIEAVAIAEKIPLGRANFVLGSALCLPFGNAAFDTVISLETIEHLEHPRNAVREYHRVLTPSGSLIGSVPTDAFEAFCAKQYGINPHHRGTFSAPRLRAILAGEFSYIRIFIARVALAAGLYESDGKTGPLHGGTITERTTAGHDYGSYFFVASNAALPPRLGVETGQLIIGGSYFAAEGQQMDRVLASNFADRAVAEVMAAKDRLVIERDVVISAHNDAMIEITQRVKSADALVQTQADQITDARQRLKDLAAGIQARDAEIEAWRDRHERSLGVRLLRSWGRVTSLGFRGQDFNA